MILIATQCFPPDHGGIEIYMAGLAETLADEGRAVTVFADGARSDWDAAQPITIRRFGGWKPIRAMRKQAALRTALRGDAAVERVFFDSWKSLETALPALRGVSPRPRLVVLAHGMEFPARPSARKRARIERALAAADAVLANSDYTARRTREFLSNPQALSVATPPIAPPSPASERDRAALRMRLGHGRLIAALARHEPRKGFDHMINAVATLAQEEAYKDLKLAIAGDGPDRVRLQSIAGQSGAPVQFLGRISEAEKAALLAEASLFAMPSRAEGDSVEGFGIVYIEAGWYGAPSLAGREGGAASAVLEGETGWLCDGASELAVCDALRAILSNPRERRRRGGAAHSHARAQLWRSRLGDYMNA